MKQHPYLACSPYAIASIDLMKISLNYNVDEYDSDKLGEHDYDSSSVEIKYVIAKNAVGNVLLRSTILFQVSWVTKPSNVSCCTSMLDRYLSKWSYWTLTLACTWKGQNDIWFTEYLSMYQDLSWTTWHRPVIYGTANCTLGSYKWSLSWLLKRCWWVQS